MDPIYFESTMYLGPGRNGDKPFRLLAEVMRDRAEVALGTFVSRGKETLVAIRPYQPGLVLHHLYFADEVRDYDEIETGNGVARREEMQLALRLVEALRRPAFDPRAFEDTYRLRVEKAAREKARGKAIREEARPSTGRGVVVDLMDALQQSLEAKGKRGAPNRRARVQSGRKSSVSSHLKAS